MKESASLNLRPSGHQASADIPAQVETPQEDMRDPVPDNDSEQYPEDDIPDEEEEDDEEDEDDDQDDADYKVSPPSFSIKLMLLDQIYISESLSYLRLMHRALLRCRPKKRRMTTTRGPCHHTTKKRKTSLMVSVCMKVSDSACPQW